MRSSLNVIGMVWVVMLSTTTLTCSNLVHDVPAYKVGEQHGSLHSLDHLQERLFGNGSGSYEVFRPPAASFPSETPPEILRRQFQHGSGTDFFEGELVTLKGDPALYFSVLEPLGGCGSGLRTVGETAASHGCDAASNGGFFDMATGACLGNLVSYGRVVQAPGFTNAAFGVDRSGRLVTGYIDGAAVLAGAFHQLVTGVVWLVRDSAPYVEQASYAENMTVQGTGDSFVTVRSARTAIGHNARGEVVLAIVNGKTGRRGANLHEMAAMLISFGAVNAINLDGGGSTTLTHRDGVLTSFPSDHCSDDNRFFCPRPVTSIICFKLH